MSPKEATTVPPLNLVVEPPKRIGSRTTQVDPALLKAMTDQFSTDHWIGDGFEYDTATDAGNAVGQYRRALAAALDIEEHTIKTRVYGHDAKGNVLTDRTKKGVWQVALSHDPNRQKVSRPRRSSNTSQ